MALTWSRLRSIVALPRSRLWRAVVALTRCRRNSRLDSHYDHRRRNRDRHDRRLSQSLGDGAELAAIATALSNRLTRFRDNGLGNRDIAVGYRRVYSCFGGRAGDWGAVSVVVDGSGCRKGGRAR